MLRKQIESGLTGKYMQTYALSYYKDPAPLHIIIDKAPVGQLEMSHFCFGRLPIASAA